MKNKQDIPIEIQERTFIELIRGAGNYQFICKACRHNSSSFKALRIHQAKCTLSLSMKSTNNKPKEKEQEKLLEEFRIQYQFNRLKKAGEKRKCKTYFSSEGLKAANHDLRITLSMDLKCDNCPLTISGKYRKPLLNAGNKVRVPKEE